MGVGLITNIKKVQTCRLTGLGLSNGPAFDSWMHGQSWVDMESMILGCIVRVGLAWISRSRMHRQSRFDLKSIVACIPQSQVKAE